MASGGEGGGVIVGRQNPTKDNGAPISVIRIVKHCGVWGGGVIGGAPKSYNK